jgi:hypothetical protein
MTLFVLLGKSRPFSPALMPRVLLGWGTAALASIVASAAAPSEKPLLAKNWRRVWDLRYSWNGFMEGGPAGKAHLIESYQLRAEV